MRVHLAASAIGIVSVRQVNAARPATLKASEAEVMKVVVSPIAAVIRRRRRVTELQQALVITQTTAIGFHA